MYPIPFTQVFINDPFWSPRLNQNATTAIFHQWDQLEKSGCIQNFRIVAHQEDGFREGWFFADSDAYKWLDAAARVYATNHNEQILTLMDSFIKLILLAQEEDGYLYTYNQIHFPNSRWQNLQIEHELYCHGHLIEAAVSHYQATGLTELLNAAQKLANLLLKTFLGAGAWATPGHEEIEIALIRLAQATTNPAYLDLAEQFLERRGRKGLFGLSILFENIRVNQRTAQRDKLREEYDQNHPDRKNQYKVPAHNASQKPPFAQARWMLSAFSGKYFQQHKPIRQQNKPVGHAVRFAYLQTAAAKLAGMRAYTDLIPVLEKSWDNLVNKRMYVTGGIGSLPLLEGFGRDYELDPEFAYAETCAALGMMFWNWEMTQLTGRACYADLFEWQLYNASMVGIGLDGCSYLYNNPLASQNMVTRQEWYQIPCCPSNLSRTWANLGGYLYTCDDDQIWIHQYVGGHVSLGVETLIRLEVTSRLPWEGKVSIRVTPKQAEKFKLHLRFPSWADQAVLQINKEKPQTIYPDQHNGTQTASGYNPKDSFYHTIERTWHPDDLIEIEFSLPIRLLTTHPRVKSTQGKIAITRGPLVYCLESTDNPAVNLFNTVLDPTSLKPEHDSQLLSGITVIKGLSKDGKSLKFIPYAFWANRESGDMTVYTSTT